MGKGFQLLRSAKKASVERVGKSVRISGWALQAMGMSWDLL